MTGSDQVRGGIPTKLEAFLAAAFLFAGAGSMYLLVVTDLSWDTVIGLQLLLVGLFWTVGVGGATTLGTANTSTTPPDHETTVSAVDWNDPLITSDSTTNGFLTIVRRSQSRALWASIVVVPAAVFLWAGAGIVLSVPSVMFWGGIGVLVGVSTLLMIHGLLTPV